MARAVGKNPDLRVSDAERDAVASELGQHFQDGRLDKAEFDERVTAAMAAKTEGDLDEVLTDLPQTAAPWPTTTPGSAHGRPRALLLLPLLVTAAVIVGLLSSGWHDSRPFAPFGLLWLIVLFVACRARIRGYRRRQWR